MVIDKEKPEFADIPDTLGGEVLLERTVDNNGNPSGFITATKAVVMSMKGKTIAERQSSGWGKYEAILDGLSIAELQKP